MVGVFFNTLFLQHKPTYTTLEFSVFYFSLVCWQTTKKKKSSLRRWQTKSLCQQNVYYSFGKQHLLGLVGSGVSSSGWCCWCYCHFNYKKMCLFLYSFTSFFLLPFIPVEAECQVYDVCSNIYGKSNSTSILMHGYNYRMWYEFVTTSECMHSNSRIKTPTASSYTTAYRVVSIVTNTTVEHHKLL